MIAMIGVQILAAIRMGVSQPNHVNGASRNSASSG